MLTQPTYANRQRTAVDRDEGLTKALQLTDLLIELTDPAKLRLFRANAERFISSLNLTDVDKAALFSGKSGLIRSVARSTPDGDNPDGKDPQFTGSSNPTLIEIDPMAEVLHEQLSNEFSAIRGGAGLLFVDEKEQKSGRRLTTANATRPSLRSA
jgi:hypothetical protein